jgi:hypothetical protein
MEKYTLWIDSSSENPDSEKAENVLRKKGIEFNVLNSPNGAWQTPSDELPHLIIPEGICYGLREINAYIQNC